jgi:hypothetical protein
MYGAGTLLIVTDEARSWAIYLSESLDEVLAFHGRTLPGPRHTLEDDEEDLRQPTLVRHLPVDVAGMRAMKFDRTKPGSPRIVVTDSAGHGYEFRFAGFRRLRTSAPADAPISVIDEIHAASGRKWLIFQPVDQTATRKLAVQADSADWVEVPKAANTPGKAPGA